MIVYPLIHPWQIIPFLRWQGCWSTGFLHCCSSCPLFSWWGTICVVLLCEDQVIENACSGWQAVLQQAKRHWMPLQGLLLLQCLEPEPFHTALWLRAGTWVVSGSGHGDDDIFILCKTALSYVKLNILSNWSNILCKCHLIMFTSENSLLWRSISLQPPFSL